jgi:acetylglutamate kinase
VITRHAQGELDLARLRLLLTASFGRPPVADVFSRPVAHVYVERAYRGAAFVADTGIGGYLSKLSVHAQEQRKGIGRALWQSVTADYPRLFWRARAQNPINSWYTRECDGLQRFPDWFVFWKGIATADIPNAVEYALVQPIDLPYRRSTRLSPHDRGRTA